MLSRPLAEWFVPDGTPLEAALARTTHLGVGAHADDLEIMAIHGILECYDRADRWFAGVIVTDGAGSARGGDELFAGELEQVRRREQKRAAELGRYGAVALLDHSSSDTRQPAYSQVTADLSAVLRATRPEVVYTHALTDAHDTHVAVTLRLLSACRALPAAERPSRILGCEVWRDLDWLVSADKVALPVDDRPELQLELLSVFESQLAAKRYDRAALGRRHAHAVFSELRTADRHDGLVWAMDLTPLAASGDPGTLVSSLVRRMEDECVARVARLGGASEG